jgi:phosphatidate cytidylyltransferase
MEMLAVADNALPDPGPAPDRDRSALLRQSSELGRRVVSAVILAVIAIAALWIGGWVFAILVIVLAAIGLWEWTGICGAADPPWLRAGLISALVVGLTLFQFGNIISALLLLAGAAAIALTVACVRRAYGWAALGIVYVTIPSIALIAFRHADKEGLLVIVFVALVVWATDIAAYFGGRSIGGPKLWARVSPKKTWSGAVSGLIGAIAVALVFPAVVGVGYWLAALILAILLSLGAQAGDLAESAFKRRFGVKDSGTVIPGHGGVLDRVDGLYVALALAWLLAIINAPLIMATFFASLS